MIFGAAALKVMRAGLRFKVTAPSYFTSHQNEATFFAQNETTSRAVFGSFNSMAPPRPDWYLRTTAVGEPDHVDLTAGEETVGFGLKKEQADIQGERRRAA